jgi:glycosyltransferase involved in cell wall biosynthesis
MKKEKTYLSVAIISYNEENNIERCLKSIIDIASEIIVVDSGSNDKTTIIAKNYGANIFIECWKGYILQKNSALSKCTKDWILFLDADEEVTKELKSSIKGAIEEDFRDGYFINRKSFYLGKLLIHTWQPDYILRLVKKHSNPCWGGYEPHAILHVIGSTDKLKGDLIHYSYTNIKEHIERLSKYAYLTAKSYKIDGKPFHLYKLIFNPLFSFIKEFILKMGFLDGIRGFLVAILSAIYVFLKYSYLWEINKNEKEQQ